jgi:hypothetical protein
MSLTRALSTIKKYQRKRISNDLIGVEVDYYYMASPFVKSKEIISIMLWTVIVDAEGFIYAYRTSHIGAHEGWKELFTQRIYIHLIDVGFGQLISNRISRNIEIKKDGHHIPTDERSSGVRIGINGADEVYIRRDRFTYI